VTTPLSTAPRVVTALPLAIDPDEVLRFQGYKRSAADTPGPEVMALFEEALSLGRRLIAPRAVVRWLRVTRQRDDAIEVGGATLSIPDVGRLWGPVEWVAAAVCTIGDELERRVAELWDARELPLAAMLDSVGSGAVESLAEYVNDLLCQEAIPLGLPVTNRVSPGYGHWDVSEQRALFSVCPGDAIGVSLNEACFMRPVKSISLLAAAGARVKVDHYFSQCGRCWMPACAYRRTPARKSVHR
jgi:hypothetical protein